MKYGAIAGALGALLFVIAAFIALVLHIVEICSYFSVWSVVRFLHALIMMLGTLLMLAYFVMLLIPKKKTEGTKETV